MSSCFKSLRKPHDGGCCCSFAKSCPTLCNPMKCRMPGFPVLHYLPEFAQTHVHWVSDAIQPSHPLLPSSPITFSLCQSQGLFQWVGSLQQVTKVLEFQHQSFQWIFQGWFPLGWTGLILQSKELSRVFSSTVVQKYQYFCAQPLYGPPIIPYMTTRKTITLTVCTLVTEDDRRWDGWMASHT